ncbi:hypothetical protein RJT34_19722 [Clitoria ternatea]|uniref:Uncharacterized protein n=1 Tax=Clitoria ternatea TaxID=43366 RepID=A0AAN9IS00_CLITE
MMNLITDLIKVKIPQRDDDSTAIDVTDSSAEDVKPSNVMHVPPDDEVKRYYILEIEGVTSGGANLKLYYL